MPMSLKNLPYLRQYARALRMDDLLGDEWIRLTLTLIEEEQDRSGAPADTRLALFEAFYALWHSESQQLREAAAAPFTDAALRESYARFPSERRQMLLLVDLLGFSVPDAASLLECDQADGERLLAEGRALRHELREGNIIILEDEVLILDDLAAIAQELGLHVFATARNRREAIAAFDPDKVDLILADQRLANGDLGLDIVRELRVQADVPAIFVTAYPEDVLTGAEGEPTFVISKPYSPASIEAALIHCLAPPDA